MYLALTRLNLIGIHDWIQEYDTFPLFGQIGGMPFPADDPARRAATIRQSIRYMQDERHSLLLFAEGVLHRPPQLLPFGKSLDMLVKRVPNVTVYPVGIRYELAMHERPECFIRFGSPIEAGPEFAQRTRLAVAAQLDRIAVDRITAPETFELLHKGTADVNERWDLRDLPVIGRRRRT